MRKTIGLALALGVAALPQAALAHAGDDEYFHHMEGFGMMGFGGSMHLFGWVSMVLLWVFLALGIIAFWKYINKK